jgi:hypothetical protein
MARQVGGAGYLNRIEFAANSVATIDLEFDTTPSGRAPLGDIAASLVSVDELLRDLATIAAYPATAEYREIQVAAISMRNPLKVSLSLLSIPEEAVNAFREICRQIILSREGRSHHTTIDAALTLCAPDARVRMTEPERQRIHAHVKTLHDAEVPLRAVVIRHA